MSPPARPLFFGRNRSRSRRFLLVGLSIAAFILTFVGYAVGFFYVSGGLVVIPYYAAIVGMLAAGSTGYLRGGMVSAWVVTYTAILGFHADHAFLGQPHRPLGYRLAYFFRPDGLGFYAIQALVLGSIAFTVGNAVRRGVDALGRKRGVR